MEDPNRDNHNPGFFPITERTSRIYKKYVLDKRQPPTKDIEADSSQEEYNNSQRLLAALKIQRWVRFIQKKKHMGQYYTSSFQLENEEDWIPNNHLSQQRSSMLRIDHYKSVDEAPAYPNHERKNDFSNTFTRSMQYLMKELTTSEKSLPNTFNYRNSQYLCSPKSAIGHRSHSSSHSPPQNNYILSTRYPSTLENHSKILPKRNPNQKEWYDERHVSLEHHQYASELSRNRPKVKAQYLSVLSKFKNTNHNQMNDSNSFNFVPFDSHSTLGYSGNQKATQEFIKISERSHSSNDLKALREASQEAIADRTNKSRNIQSHVSSNNTASIKTNSDKALPISSGKKSEGQSTLSRGSPFSEQKIKHGQNLICSNSPSVEAHTYSSKSKIKAIKMKSRKDSSKSPKPMTARPYLGQSNGLHTIREDSESQILYSQRSSINQLNAQQKQELRNLFKSYGIHFSEKVDPMAEQMLLSILLELNQETNAEVKRRLIQKLQETIKSLQIQNPKVNALNSRRKRKVKKKTRAISEKPEFASYQRKSNLNIIIKPNSQELQFQEEDTKNSEIEDMYPRKQSFGISENSYSEANNSSVYGKQQDTLEVEKRSRTRSHSQINELTSNYEKNISELNSKIFKLETNLQKKEGMNSKLQEAVAQMEKERIQYYNQIIAYQSAIDDAESPKNIDSDHSHIDILFQMEKLNHIYHEKISHLNDSHHIELNELKEAYEDILVQEKENTSKNVQEELTQKHLLQIKELEEHFEQEMILRTEKFDRDKELTKLYFNNLRQIKTDYKKQPSFSENKSLYIYRLKEQNIEYRKKILELQGELIAFSKQFDKMRDFYKKVLMSTKNKVSSQSIFPKVYVEEPIDPSAIDTIYNMVKENAAIKDQIMAKLKNTLQKIEQPLFMNTNIDRQLFEEYEE